MPRNGVSFSLRDADCHEEEKPFVERWSGIVDCLRVGLLFENSTFPDMKVTEKRLPYLVRYKTMPTDNDGTVTVCCLDGFKDTNVGQCDREGHQGDLAGRGIRESPLLT